MPIAPGRENLLPERSTERVEAPCQQYNSRKPERRGVDNFGFYHMNTDGKWVTLGEESCHKAGADGEGRRGRGDGWKQDDPASAVDPGRAAAAPSGCTTMK